MKFKKILFAAGIFFNCTIATVNAQDNNIKIEKVVNDQFGTLLESLLTNGKIDETAAKTYLETVFGYSDGVSSYLQMSDLSAQIKKMSQGKVASFNDFEKLSNSLLDLVPAKYQNEIRSNLQIQSLINGSINEISSGQIGESTLQLVDGIIQGIKEDRERIAKEKQLLEKIKALTPTLTALDKNPVFSKKSKYSIPLTKENWTEIPAPDWSKKTSRLNRAVVTAEGIEFDGDWKNFSPPTYQFKRFFRNTERFDFSKDFRAEFEISVDDSRTYNFFEIQLAGMYQVQLMCYQAKNTKAFTITTPKKYFLTNKYGVFYNTQFTRPNGFKSTIIRDKNNLCVDYTKPIKVIMKKTGSQLIFQFNDCTETVNIDMDYFCNKYQLDFRFAGKVVLHSMTLEHL
jgi:hypothetical protein